MTGKNKNKASIVALLAILFSWGMANWFTAEVKDETSLHLGSKQTRNTQLGKIKVSKKNKKGEYKVILNDPKMSQKWGLKKTDAQRAWNVSQGSKKITVAIIDTGIDVNHKDLRNNLWVNKGEVGLDINGKDKASNKIDDDGNGFVDDVHGWNFVSNNNSLTDNHGHGTHIAGIVGAEGGNGFGISGVSPKVSVMILKYYDPKAPGTNNLENTIKAIKYAVRMNVDIINYSGGGLEFSQKEYDAIVEAKKKNILFVAAAGNEHSNSDKSKYYPADYGLTNIISVTAANQKDTILPSSNYGRKTVDIQAPGFNIYSTLPNNSFGHMTGTSQATAFATGVAVLVKAHNSNFSAEQIKKYILRTGDDVPISQRKKTRMAKRLNIYKALVTLDSDVAVSGVVARNTANIQHGTFKARDSKSTNIKINHSGLIDVTPADVKPSVGAADPADQISNFSSDLNQILQKAMKANPNQPSVRKRPSNIP
jgi:subtilisin family serine protease